MAPPLNPHRRYTGLLLQQGRVVLDRDTSSEAWVARIEASFGHGLTVSTLGQGPAPATSVRRLAQQIEAALDRGLSWVAFEPSGPALWGQVRIAATNYLMGVFRSGVLAGASPDQAFFVRCDATTMTQNDIDNGRLNLIVGFAPAEPAEFVILVIGLLTAD